MRMCMLSRVFLIICVISNVKAKTEEVEFGNNHGITIQDDWSKLKLDLTIKDLRDFKLSKRIGTDDPNKLDELFSLGKESVKKFKYKLNLNENELEDFYKDQVFIEEKAFHKRSMKSFVKPYQEGETNPENFLNLPKSENSELHEVQNFEIQEFKAIDDIENVETEFSTSNAKLEHSLSVISDNDTNNISVQTDSISLNQRSFIFNPSAGSQEQFQNCTTPKNESGTCKYLQHCLIPTIVSSLNQFMDYVCIIEERFIGLCCPNFPVSVVVVQDQKGHSSKQESELNEDCGIGTNTRIVGGSKADPKAWPWMVALFSKYRKRFFCGGALINDRYILTAAHCTYGVLNNEIIARIGEYDFKDDGESHDDYTVVEIKRHGHYNRRTLHNDIALLKLEKPVVFNEFVKTICFPEEENDYVGEKATLAGWGNLAGGGATSDILQQASFPVISNEKCSKGHGLPIPESLICTGSKSGDKGACNGDSGGPLMLLDKNNRWKVIGLVSWGRRGCNPEYPTVYTRVSYFLEWIKKHAR